MLPTSRVVNARISSGANWMFGILSRSSGAFSRP